MLANIPISMAVPHPNGDKLLSENCSHRYPRANGAHSHTAQRNLVPETECALLCWLREGILHTCAAGKHV